MPVLVKNKFYPFGSLLGPNKGQPIDFRTFESPFPKDTSYQIWLKSVQWFLKEKLTDDRRTMNGEWSRWCQTDDGRQTLRQGIRSLAFGQVSY